MSKTYTLELTAEEVMGLNRDRLGLSDNSTWAKLAPLVEQARADREADELRLPWRAIGAVCHSNDGRTDGPGTYCGYAASEPAAKLMSAAPELLEAVRAWMRTYPKATLGNCVALSDRALRKVETGIPEDK